MTRAPITWHQSMGHKGPVLRPRCIGTERCQTQLLLYSALHSNLLFKSVLINMHRTIILPLVLYVCETCFLTFKEGRCQRRWTIVC